MTTGNKTSILLPDAKNDISGYHDYIYLLLQNLIYTSTDDAVNNNSQFPFRFWVDYVRLYQDPENSNNGLIYLDENGNKVDYYK